MSYIANHMKYWHLLLLTVVVSVLGLWAYSQSNHAQFLMLKKQTNDFYWRVTESGGTPDPDLGPTLLGKTSEERLSALHEKGYIKEFKQNFDLQDRGMLELAMNDIAKEFEGDYILLLNLYTTTRGDQCELCFMHREPEYSRVVDIINARLSLYK